MKATDLKPFEMPKVIEVKTTALGGVSGFAGAYRVVSSKINECNVIKCTWQEGVVMGSKTLIATIKFELNGKVGFGDVRFFDDGNGFIQNRNSLSGNLRTN